MVKLVEYYHYRQHLDHRQNLRHLTHLSLLREHHYHIDLYRHLLM